MSEPPSSFATIKQAYGPEEVKEKGSRFISYLYPVESIEAATAILHSLRKQYHDATHVCFAFRLGQGVEDYFRHNDDGEPGGTAGIPIYKEINRKKYYNVLLAVVRYFGGTKLGTGGLARAYQQAARQVIQRSKVIVEQITRPLTIESPFQYQGELRKLMDHFSTRIIQESYSAAGISMNVAVPIAHHQKFQQKIAVLGKGKISVKED